jgi:hypothetical protein
MRISEIISETSAAQTLATVAPTLAGNSVSSAANPLLKSLGQFGPGIVSAAQDLVSGRYPSALLNAFTAVAPNVNINPAVRSFASTLSNLQLLLNIAKNPLTLGAFLAIYSPGLNSGEDAEIRRIHAAQDAAQNRVQRTSTQ